MGLKTDVSPVFSLSFYPFRRFSHPLRCPSLTTLLPSVLGRSATMLSLDRYTNNQIVTISYWKSREHLARFAQAPPHMKAWVWWNKMIKDNTHLSIMHEVYDVPAGCWENIYVNSHTLGMGMLTFFQTIGTGETRESWCGRKLAIVLDYS